MTPNLNVLRKNVDVSIYRKKTKHILDVNMKLWNFANTLNQYCGMHLLG